MYLVRSHREYYKVVESYRLNGKVCKKTLKYVGHLCSQRYNHLRAMLRNRKEQDLEDILKQYHSELPTKPEYRPDMVKRVSVQGGEKVVINKDYLLNCYRDKCMTIDSMAKSLGVHRTKVSQHLDEMAITPEERIEIRNKRSASRAGGFGWYTQFDQRIINPVEYKIIQDMVRWSDNGAGPTEIAHKLNRLKIKTRSGKALWDKGTVGRIIKRNVSKSN